MASLTNRYFAGSRRGALALTAACLLGPNFCGPAALANPATQQSIRSDGSPGRETGLRVPRFVSLKSKEARMRVGPSLDHATQWVYQVPGLPLEIIAEYDNWRQVRDCDGISGWMHRALLSGRRTALIGPWITAPVPIRAAPRASANTVANLAARVRLAVQSCDGAWCHVEIIGHDLDGFVRQSALWGVYPNEKIM